LYIEEILMTKNKATASSPVNQSSKPLTHALICHWTQTSARRHGRGLNVQPRIAIAHRSIPSSPKLQYAHVQPSTPRRASERDVVGPGPGQNVPRTRRQNSAPPDRAPTSNLSLRDQATETAPRLRERVSSLLLIYGLFVSLTKFLGSCK
jgi:hypothetical protein